MLIHQDGYTALMWAALQDRATIVTLLVDKGASIDNTDKVEFFFLGIMLCKRCGRGVERRTGVIVM